MDYKRIYDDLMQSRLLLKEDRIKLRKMGEYFEAHHIIPKSMGGEGTTKNVKHDNIVLLTGREHYIAHTLLWLIHRNREMTSAFNAMCISKQRNKRKYVVSSRMYEFLKLEQRLLGVSDKTKEKMRQVRLGKKLSPETKEKMRQGKLGKPLSPEHVAKIRQSNLGREVSPETRERIRQTLLGRKLSPEIIAKIRQSNLGKKLSPESIKKREETKKRNRLLKLAQMNGDIDWSRWEENK